MPKIKFIEMNIHYKNREKKLDKLKSKLADNNFKKSIREQRLEMKAATRSINYRRVSPQSIFTRNNNKNYYADGVNKLSQHRNIFMTTRSVFSTLTTFFPILFVFSITGEINLAYIFPIGFGLFAVIITILQTIIFAKRYTRVDTIDYLNDLFYIVKWYVSFRNIHTNKIKE